MQQELHEQLKVLEKKIQTLVREYQHSQHSLQKVRTENEQLRRLVEQQNEQLDTLMYETTLLKSGQVVPNPEHDLAGQLSEYIEKIDRCIQYLNNQL